MHSTRKMAHFSHAVILVLSRIKGTKMSVLQAMYDCSLNLICYNSRMMKLFYIKIGVSGVSEQYHCVSFVLNTFTT